MRILNGINVIRTDLRILEVDERLGAPLDEGPQLALALLLRLLLLRLDAHRRVVQDVVKDSLEKRSVVLCSIIIERNLNDEQQCHVETYFF